MITIICATHRPQNQTLKVVSIYKHLLEEQNVETQVFRMDELPNDFTISDTFGNRSEEALSILKNKIEPANKLVVISPEYNGSYPGVFKAFLDGVEPRTWREKKIALVGVASGRAGNLRGMDHLTDVFHYLRAEVFSMKVPISQLDSLFDENDALNEDTIAVLKMQVEEFLEF